MTSASRRAEFFALEANEYLADLANLAAARDRPDAERLVRGARALRGAALMAGLGTYARAAAGLEAIARQVRDHALPWEPHARQVWTDGLDALRALVPHAPTWDAAEDRQALLLVERCDQVLHGRPAQPPPQQASTLTPGVRAFIARESALIAGSLEQASHALAPVPPTAALSGVLERMQSLRGLGASAELSPLPELLDAMEVATRTLLADLPAPPDVSVIFADASRALAAMARMIADSGRLTAPPELASIARRLLDSYATDTDIVPIGTLAPDGVASVVQVGGTPPPLPAGDPVPVELVSVGDHLLAVADALSRPGAETARDLRLFVLHRTLATMPSRSATGQFLAPLAEAITAAISQQIAAQRPDAFVAMLRGSGRFLVEAGGVRDRAALLARRDAIASSLMMVSAGAPAGGFDLTSPAEARREPPRELPRAPEEVRAPKEMPATPPLPAPPAAVHPPAATPRADDTAPRLTAPPADTPEDLPIVDIGELAPDTGDEDVVPIESLAPDPVVAIPETAPGAPSRLEAAYRARPPLGDGADATLSGLIGIDIVPVADMLYRGDSALARAEEVRGELRVLLDQPDPTFAAVRLHLEELLDLIPLARHAA